MVSDFTVSYQKWTVMAHNLWVNKDENDRLWLVMHQSDSTINSKTDCPEREEMDLNKRTVQFDSWLSTMVQKTVNFDLFRWLSGFAQELLSQDRPFWGSSIYIFGLSSLNQIQNSSFRNNTELYTSDNFKWFSTRRWSMDKICPRDPRFPMPLCSQSCEFDFVSANSNFWKFSETSLAISRIRLSIIAVKFGLLTTIQIIHHPNELPSVMVL